MSGVRLPGEEELPPGPKRELVVAIHRLYRLAGKPALKSISRWILKDNSLDVTLSHEGVRIVLRGDTLPRWQSVRSVAIVLIEQSVEHLDRPAEIQLLQKLWIEADEPADEELRIEPFKASPEQGKSVEFAATFHEPTSVPAQTGSVVRPILPGLHESPTPIMGDGEISGETVEVALHELKATVRMSFRQFIFWSEERGGQIKE